MRNKKKLCAGILMLLLLTGCSSQEVLQEVPQTIVLPESQIDTMPVQETAAAENDNTESFSLLEEGGSRFAYESLEAPEQIWYLEIEQALGEMEGTVKLSTDPLEQGLDEQDIDKIFQCVMIDHPEIFYATGYTYTKYSRGEKTVGIDFAGSYELTEEEAIVRAEQIRKITADWIRGIGEDKSEYEKVKAVYEQIIFATDRIPGRSVCLPGICQSDAISVEPSGSYVYAGAGNRGYRRGACLESGQGGRRLLLCGYHMGRCFLSHGGWQRTGGIVGDQL